jgi:hypothetical protein
LQFGEEGGLVDDAAVFVGVFYFDGDGGGLCAVDGFVDGGDEVDGEFDEAEEEQHGVRAEFDVEVDRFAGVVGGDGETEEVVAHVVQEKEAFLADEFGGKGGQQSGAFGVDADLAVVGVDLHEWFDVVFEELLLLELFVDYFVGEFVLHVDLLDYLQQFLLGDDFVETLAFVAAVEEKVAQLLSPLFLQT